MKKLKNFNQFINESRVNWGNYIKKGKLSSELEDIEFDKEYAKNADFDSDVDPRISFYTAYFEKIDDYVSISLSRGESIGSPKTPYILQVDDAYGNSYFEEFETFEKGLKRLGELLDIRKPEVYKAR